MAPGYARTGTTTPLTMFSAPPPPPRLPADIDRPAIIEPAPALAPLDLGPPLAPWYAETVEPARPAPAPPTYRPGVVQVLPSTPAKGNPGSTTEPPRLPGSFEGLGGGGMSAQNPGAAELSASPPPPTRAQRLEQSAGPGAGRGEVSNPAGTTGPPGLPGQLSPGRPRPLRGPAAGVLGWRRGVSFRRRARMPEPAKVGGIGGLAQDTGNVAGFTPAKLAEPPAPVAA